MADPTLPERLAGVHPQMATAQLRTDAKADPQKLADLRRAIGQLVERALVLAGISKQEAAFQMRYSDPGVVSRWCSGVERPLFDKLFTIDGFPAAYVQAIAEQRPEFTVTITIARVA